MRTQLLPLVSVLGLVVVGEAGAQAFPNVQPPQLNPITSAKALLGKALFWDEQLSSTGTTACATCHVPAAGGTDPRVVFPGPGVAGTVNPGPDALFGTGDDRIGSPGVPKNLAGGGYLDSAWGLAPQVTGRKAPTMINAAFARDLFWDGRAGPKFYDPITGVAVLDGKAALESQAAGPPVSEVEMGHAGIDWTQIVSRIALVRPLALASNVPADLASFVADHGYPALFQTAFGSGDVTAARVAMAIATYERTLISNDSRFDRWAGGQAPQWLTPQEDSGRNVFFGPGNCTQCHNAPTFTDDNFHYLGVSPVAEDLGRGGITGNNNDRGKFKTPTLRNVGLQRHFMHNGRLASLADVVEFYDRGGDFPGAQINPLGLSAQQKSDLVAFLHTLTDERVQNELPPFDRPQLFSESARVPLEYGHGTAGSGGFVPDAVALEPGLLGNPRWTIGLQHAYGGSIAVLAAALAPAPDGFPILGVQAFLSPAPALWTIDLTLLAGTGAGQGFGSLVVPMPADPLLAGQVYLQWVALDPAGLEGFSATEAVRLTIF